MSVPRRFVGAWERAGLEIEGEAVRGAGRAVWIEAGGLYIDVRAPGTVASGTSFGGRSAWRAPRFTWHHDHDLDPHPGRVDRGVLTVAGDHIIEQGVGLHGGAGAYEERWQRVSAADCAPAIANNDRGLAVRVGDYAGLIFAGSGPGSNAARLWQRVSGKWVGMISLGARTETPVPDDSGWRLTRGWTAR